MTRVSARCSLAFAYAIALAFALACGSHRPSADERQQTELAVWRLVLDSSYGAGAGDEVVVEERLRALTSSSLRFSERWARDSVPDLPPNVFDNFRRAMADTSAITAFAVHRGTMRMISSDSMRYYFPGDPRGEVPGWSAFRLAHPHARGIATLSRVGLSDDGMWALVYSGRQSDWLAGAGFLYVARRGQNGWAIVRRRLLWVS